MQCIRIDYHEKSRLPLISGPLRESVEALRFAHPDTLLYIRSGWLHGPHLELCLEHGDAEIDVMSQVQAIERWVVGHPSRTVLVEAEYEATSRKLGALEGIAGPFMPLRPNNGVGMVEHRQHRLVDGHESLQQPYGRFFNRSTAVLFRLAELKQGDVSLATIVLIGMLARAADQFEPEGIERGYLSLQAHADFFFANYDRSGQVRKQYDRMEQAWRTSLRDAVAGRPQEAAVGGQEGDRIAETMRMWEDVLEETKADIKQTILGDRSWFYYSPNSFPSELGDEHMEAFVSAGMPIRMIERGATLTKDLNQADQEFFQSEEFQTYRVILNMFYSFLRTLGVSPVERFGLCYLVSTTYCAVRDDRKLA